MKVLKEERINLPYVLTNTDIERIAKRFDNTHSLIFKSVCADKVIREFTSVDDLLQFENSSNKEIESLGINIFTKDNHKNAYIYFSKAPVDNILFRLEGEENEVLNLLEFLHERLHASETWYGFIARVKYSGLIITIFISYIPIFLLLPSFRQYMKNASSSITTWVIIISATIALTLISNFIWAWIRTSYFPMGVFTIGQGAKRHENKETIRTVVIIGFILSLITGFILNVI